MLQCVPTASYYIVIRSHARRARAQVDLPEQPELVHFHGALAEYEPPKPFAEITERLQQHSARIVVFGAPGIGKSALSKALAFQFTEVWLQRTLPGQPGALFLGTALQALRGTRHKIVREV